MMVDSKLKIIPLGGVGEIGKNMILIEYEDSIIVIDCGIMFPDLGMPGVDYIIPDMHYLIENKEKVLGLFLTHGHEDHIGAIPYLFKETIFPIYGTRLTLGLIKNKLEEHQLNEHTVYYEITPRNPIQKGPFEIEFIQTTHSLADCCALLIKTPVGNIVHTGDFKIDHNPVDKRYFDFYRFSQLGEEGILVLLSDSTNVEREGFSKSEIELAEPLYDAVMSTEGRVIIATFSTNFLRIQQIANLAKKSNRKIVFSGKSMLRNVQLARDLNYLNIPDEVIVDIEDLATLSPSQSLVITTGTQGEPMSSLDLMSREHHKFLKLHTDDTIIISASTIPGNEKTVSMIVNNLFKTGAQVLYLDIDDVHVSGHAYREELKLMLSLTRPRFFIPIHGEFRHLVHHAGLAEKLGLDSRNIIIAQDGDIIEVKEDSINKRGFIETDLVLVDGKGIGDVSKRVLKDRRILSSDGIAVVLIVLDINSKKLKMLPDIITRGFVYVKESNELIEKAISLVNQIVSEYIQKNKHDLNNLKADITGALRSFFVSEIARRPMIVVRIIEV